MKELVLYALLLFTAVLVLTANNTFASDESRAPEAPDNQYCTEDGCPGEHNALETASESSTQSWNVFSTIKDTLTTVKDTIKYNVYKAGSTIYNKTEEVYNKIADFAEQVRVVFREEFTTFLEVIWEVAVAANDSLFWKFKNAVANKLMIAGLIIICLVLDFIIWNISTGIITALIWMLTLDSAVLLAYKLLGPAWVYRAFWKAVGYVWYTHSFIWTYPYRSAGIICGLVVLSMAYSIYQCISRRQRREWLRDQNTLINERLRRIEEKQDEILRLLRARDNSDSS